MLLIGYSVAVFLCTAEIGTKFWPLGTSFPSTSRKHIQVCWDPYNISFKRLLEFDLICEPRRRQIATSKTWKARSTMSWISSRRTRGRGWHSRSSWRCFSDQLWWDFLTSTFDLVSSMLFFFSGRWVYPLRMKTFCIFIRLGTLSFVEKFRNSHISRYSSRDGSNSSHASSHLFMPYLKEQGRYSTGNIRIS